MERHGETAGATERTPAVGAWRCTAACLVLRQRLAAHELPREAALLERNQHVNGHLGLLPAGVGMALVVSGGRGTAAAGRALLSALGVLGLPVGRPRHNEHGSAKDLGVVAQPVQPEDVLLGTSWVGAGKGGWG